jgi:hypothetical protein
LTGLGQITALTGKIQTVKPLVGGLFFKEDPPTIEI